MTQDSVGTVLVNKHENLGQIPGKHLKEKIVLCTAVVSELLMQDRM